MSRTSTNQFDINDALAGLDEQEAARKAAAIDALLSPAVDLFNERCAGTVMLADGRAVTIRTI